LRGFFPFDGAVGERVLQSTTFKGSGRWFLAKKLTKFYTSTAMLGKVDTRGAVEKA